MSDSPNKLHFDPGLVWERRGVIDGETWKLLVHGMARSGVSITLQGPEGEYLLVTNLPDCWELAAGKLPTETKIFGELLGGELVRLRSKLDGPGSSTTLEYATPHGRYFQFIAEAIGLPDRPLTMMTIIELTEERRRERVLRALLREVTHRSKNLLAIVHAIAAQSARTSPNLPNFMRKFQGRLYSLSQSQDLITDSNWSGARFRALARYQVSKYLGEFSPAIRIEGDDPLLAPNEALHVGLFLHELVVDAVATQDAAGRFPDVRIACTQTRREPADILTISWTEKHRDGEYTASLRDEQDFTSAVLNRIVPIALNGKAQRTAERDGFTYSLVFPASTGE